MFNFDQSYEVGNPARSLDRASPDNTVEIFEDEEGLGELGGIFKGKIFKKVGRVVGGVFTGGLSELARTKAAKKLAKKVVPKKVRKAVKKVAASKFGGLVFGPAGFAIAPKSSVKGFVKATKQIPQTAAGAAMGFVAGGGPWGAAAGAAAGFAMPRGKGIKGQIFRGAAVGGIAGGATGGILKGYEKGGWIGGAKEALGPTKSMLGRLSRPAAPPSDALVQDMKWTIPGEDVALPTLVRPTPVRAGLMPEISAPVVVGTVAGIGALWMLFA